MYGPADVLHVEQVDRPVPGEGEVVVRVHAAGLDRGTWHFMTGIPYLGRLAFGLRVPRNPVLGMDVAGTVVTVGSEVSRFKEGDKVYGVAKGSFADYAVAREDKLAPMPNNLSFEQAVVVPVSGSTALQGLRDHGRIERGQKVLIVGASGGVGTYAVQLAKAFGAEVTGVASTSKVDLVRSIGADNAIDYTTEDFADGSRRYDLIIDIGGRRPLSVLRRALTPKGTIVLLGGEDGGKFSGGMGRQLLALVLSAFVDQRFTMFVAKQNHSYLDTLKELIESGAVTPFIDKAYEVGRCPRRDASARGGRGSRKDRHHRVKEPLRERGRETGVGDECNSGRNTTLGSLVVMGAISGVPVGVAQGLLLRGKFSLWAAWMVAMPFLWAVGWAVTTTGGI